ncbi:MAG TPA: branched-chain amino acid ABC transporter permease [Hyphomicrobiales bacterium]|nr:branched-chain amino acid ABC transporter permease [Hyphomicrobiales bacterium]
MATFIDTYRSLFDLICVYGILSLAQYVSFRGGVLSLATPGFALIGAYAGAILLMKTGVGPFVGAIGATAAGAVAGLILALPLARLRGVFPAIATIGFMQILVSLALYAEPITGGALGFNGIPKVATTPYLVAAVALVVACLAVVNRTGIGRAFDAIRQDVTVAQALGISVAHYSRVNFALSGAIAGLGGCLLAYNTYSVMPDEFGFPMLVLVTATVILGGRSTIAGALVGTVVLLVLPEVARPLRDERLLVQGALLVLVITYMPLGIVDSLMERRSLTVAARESRDGADKASA